MIRYHRSKGFSLVEVVVTIGIFVILSVGIYSASLYVFRVVHQSRVRIIESALLTEQIEVVRNLGYAETGTLGGPVPGPLMATSTVTRNGLNFLVTRRVMNYDHPFDGLINTSPTDTAPVDFKFIEIEVACLTCKQQNPVRMDTFVGPRALEGDPTQGALFIEVFDANGQPVPDATVHVVSVSTTPAYDFVLPTDNEGMLKLIGMASGQNVYHITVSKSGYTTDQTVEPTIAIPTPLKPPASVVPEEVTELSFSIDRVSSLGLQTITPTCDPSGLIPVEMTGTRLIADDPTDVLLINTSTITNASGLYTFSALPWDSYSLVPQGFTMMGAIPQLPFSLLPASDQPVNIVLTSALASSLLINVRDSSTRQPIPEATVSVSRVGFSNVQTTGVGFVRQTDWSGGSGQEMIESIDDEDEYVADNGFVDVTTSTGNVFLRLVGETYPLPGELESSTFDLGVAPLYGNILWEPQTQPVEAGTTSLRFQLATSGSPTGTFAFVGPDGTTSTFYIPGQTVIHAGHNSQRYMRYKAFLSTENTSSTPIFSDLLVTYTNSCTPPGQVFIPTPPSDPLTIVVTKAGYQTTTSTISVSGNETLTIDLPLAN